MTQAEFVMCWQAACRHQYASFREEQGGAHFFGHWWYVKVGVMEFCILYGPYIEGRHNRSSITASAYINGKNVTGKDVYFSNEDSLRMIDIWETRQCLDILEVSDRVMEYLNEHKSI